MVAVEKTGDVIVTPDGQALIVQLLNLPAKTTAQMMVYVMRREAILIVILIKVLIALKALEAPKASVSVAKLTTELNA